MWCEVRGCEVRGWDVTAHCLPLSVQLAKTTKFIEEQLALPSPPLASADSLAHEKLNGRVLVHCESGAHLGMCGHKRVEEGGVTPSLFTHVHAGAAVVVAWLTAMRGMEVPDALRVVTASRPDVRAPGRGTAAAALLVTHTVALAAGQVDMPPAFLEGLNEFREGVLRRAAAAREKRFRELRMASLAGL
jgi:hypothetical protein